MLKCMIMVAAAGLGQSYHAAAADNLGGDSDSKLQFTLGLKLFSNRTSGDGLAAVGSTLFLDEYRSSTEISVIPVAGIRYGNLILSASHFANTDYNVTTSSRIPTTSKRSETDLNLGWYVLPSLAISLGYKEGKISATNATAAITQAVSNFELKGPTAGLSASASLANRVGLYANWAYSRVKDSKFPIDLGPLDYITSEVGLSWSLLAESAAHIRGLNLILGYRAQRLESRNELLVINTMGSIPVRAYYKRAALESNGWLLGLFGTF